MYGKKSKINKKKVCSICEKTYEGYGNNAEPINEGRCCDKCNSTVVLNQRLNGMLKHLKTS